jgi:hypothetical protein
MTSNNFFDHLPSSHYCRACKLSRNEEGCVVFAQAAYMFPSIHPEDFLDQPVDSLNMLYFIDDDNSTQAYQLSNNEESSQPKIFPLRSRQLEPYRRAMVPTSMAVRRGQVSNSEIRDAQTRTTTMVAEITKTYGRRNKSPNDQPRKVTAENEI